MILLKSNDRYDDVLRLDPDTGITELISRKSEQEPILFKGHFSVYDGDYVCIYRWNDKMLFRRMKDIIEIPRDATATLEESGSSKILRILSGDTELCRWRYPKPKFDFIDALMYVDDEYKDFGLFLHNVINDTTRQDGMYR